ncbi:hypothetical protein Tsubulata_008171 [Turnera subulata]|uniref:Peptidase M14 domain-containing protein n=1 Tax=Turnera subulata TaxID=218843 RepID=A0A9Q0GHN7_9ROSI|nr:hypothetical protein Tsubulata_008171 [Turnera subulata]
MPIKVVISSLSLFSLLFYSLLLLLLHPAIARGPHHSSLPSGLLNATAHSGPARLLFQDTTQPHHSDDIDRGYMTNSELEKAVKDFGDRCGSISRIYSIGHSVNGVPLWVIEISDKPGQEEPEPAFKFIGNVHGDEPVGRELLILLANWICDNYMKDPLATLIVENIHLHILPTMNPDGFSLKRRGNANDIDLNRDFPDQYLHFADDIPFMKSNGQVNFQFFPVNNDMDARQPETIAVMNWLREIRFTASATLHGGALVANYPWDGTEDKRRYYYGCPDDDTFQFMASIYSNSHRNMSLSKEFPGGITNGASWYPIYGGMQDWNYIHAGCFELTLEISDDKWPNAIELPTLWEYNKMSLLNLAASLVKVKAGRTFADYHRLIPPAERYEVVATMPGYKSKTTCISLGETAMTLDFILDPEIPTMTYLHSVNNDCHCIESGKPSLERFWRLHSEVYLILIAILALLCILLKRRIKSNMLNHKQLPKRSAQT